MKLNFMEVYLYSNIQVPEYMHYHFMANYITTYIHICMVHVTFNLRIGVAGGTHQGICIIILQPIEFF
jgi:membrane-anchored glycerophosphoryl diester phosphodiesterase (GDPDase)